MRFPTFHVILITEYHVLPTIMSIMSSLLHIVFLALPYAKFTTYQTNNLVVRICSNVHYTILEGTKHHIDLPLHLGVLLQNLKKC